MSTKYDPAFVPADIVFVETSDASLDVFCSIADAEKQIEPEHVEDGVYLSAYGPRGQHYGISILGEGVSIEPTGQENQPGELKSLLLRYFECCEDPADAHEPLEELVVRAWAIECGYRRRCGSDEEIQRRKMPWWGHVLLIALPLLGLYWALRHR